MINKCQVKHTETHSREDITTQVQEYVNRMLVSCIVMDLSYLLSDALS